MHLSNNGNFVTAKVTASNSSRIPIRELLVNNLSIRVDLRDNDAFGIPLIEDWPEVRYIEIEREEEKYICV